MELRQMNEEASSNRDGITASETFQRQYATVVLQLKEVNKQVRQELPSVHLHFRCLVQLNGSETMSFE